MRDLLKRYFGYDEFRPLQEDIIQTVMGGGDALVLMPTGGGKSLCYQLPALAMPGITLVISPLIALMKDQVDALMENGVAAAFLNSTLSGEEAYGVETRALSGELKILYLAPERLATPGFQSLMLRLRVSFIAIDEAHCISEWGHDFRPDYRNLRALRQSFPSVPVMALTATATPRVREDIVAQLSLGKARTFLSSFNRPNLRYSVRPKNDALGQLVRLLRQNGDAPAIAYCFSRKDTEALAADLVRAGFNALPYHAGLEREERKRTQEKFIRDQVPVIVATIAFGMGIDKPDVRLVAHMDLPKTIEGYYQETGRAGRDGLPSECVLFYTFGDKRKQEYFIQMIENPEEQALARKKLAQVVDYCETSACRRKYLLDYFAEPSGSATCGNCDRCDAPPTEERDATELSQKILSAVLRTGEMFGGAYVCDVLRGSRKERILEKGHEKLSVYGIARDVPVDDLREHLQCLQQKGYLEKNEGEYPTLRVSRMGKQALADRSPIQLPVQVREPAMARPGRAAQASSGDLAFDRGLFEELRRTRRGIAEEQNVPPFIIFGDRTLQEMACYAPRSTAALGSVFGVGARKLEAYGAAFVQAIRDYADANEIEEKTLRGRESAGASTSPNPSLPRRGNSGTGSSTLSRTRELLAQKRSVEEMARERGIAEGTIIQHLASLRAEEPDLDIDHLRPTQDRLDAVRDAILSIRTPFLGPLKAKLGNGYSYDEIKLAKLFLEE